MPKYVYACKSCDRTTVARRGVEARNEAVLCEFCGAVAERVFSARFQLITQREIDQPENKYAFGFSETERSETRRADDAEYERNWEGAATGVTRVTPKEALAKQSLNDVFQHL